jgi:two-component system NarL family sensor kinase
MAGVALQIETADALLEAGAQPERVRQALSQALSLTRASLEEARRSVLDLRAAPLEGRCLSDALGLLAAATEETIGPRVRFAAVGAHRPLPPRLEAGLYRIAQEALANAARHSGAREIAITLEVTPERVLLRLEDDGRGFDPSTIPRDRFGLMGLNERVRLLGGRLRLQTEPGAGTRLEVEVPVADGRSAG